MSLYCDFGIREPQTFNHTTWSRQPDPPNQAISINMILHIAPQCLRITELLTFWSGRRREPQTNNCAKIHCKESGTTSGAKVNINENNPIRNYQHEQQVLVHGSFSLHKNTSAPHHHKHYTNSQYPFKVFLSYSHARFAEIKWCARKQSV